MTFENAWATPVCSAARASLLTGRYPYRTGIGGALRAGDNKALDPREVTIADGLERTDPAYTSAVFGKWHLAEPFAGNEPCNLGFEQWSITPRNISDFCSYDLYRNGVMPCSSVLDSAVSTYATTQFTADAIDFIDKVDGPWFTYLAYHAGHSPWHAPPQALIRPERFTPTGDLTTGFCTIPAASLNPCDAPCGDSHIERRAFYEMMIEAMDMELERLIFATTGAVDLDQALNAFLTRTVVILLGDNGSPQPVSFPPFVEDAPSQPPPGVGHKAKGSVYQGGVRVPLVIAGPGVAGPGVDGSGAPNPPRRATALVSIVDLFDTIVELAGGVPSMLPGPANELCPNNNILPYERDSVSLLPLLATPNSAEDDNLVFVHSSANGDYVFTEFFREGCNTDPVNQERALIGVSSNTLYKVIQRKTDDGTCCLGFIDPAPAMGLPPMDYFFFSVAPNQDPTEENAIRLDPMFPWYPDFTALKTALEAIPQP